MKRANVARKERGILGVVNLPVALIVSVGLPVLAGVFTIYRTFVSPIEVYGDSAFEVRMYILSISIGIVGAIFLSLFSTDHAEKRFWLGLGGYGLFAVLSKFLDEPIFVITMEALGLAASFYAAYHAIQFYKLRRVGRMIPNLPSQDH
jgi:hypothetical protein